jgi:putative ABC transport system ATP-binding protein
VGQRQRVAVARALANAPEVLFADEPTASLDRSNAQAVVDLMAENRGDTTLVLVTHDREILRGADRVVEMWDGAIAT